MRFVRSQVPGVILIEPQVFRDPRGFFLESYHARKFAEGEIPEVLLITPKVFGDARGFFLESFSAQRYAEAGIALPFVQDNHSHSVRGTLRGLHAQLTRPQGKLVRAVMGEMYDVAVDIRRGSPTFARWYGVRLSGDNFRQLWVPPGFAHGFCVLSDTVHVEYKCTDFYDRADEITVAWDDPAIGVDWPVAHPIVSDKDRAAPRLADMADRLPSFPG